MTHTNYLCKVEQIRAVAKNLPFIDTIEPARGDVIRIHYKPVTLNKAIIEGLYISFGPRGATLAQNARGGLEHPHSDGAKLCSDGHGKVTRELDASRIENALYEALISFCTVNPKSIINYTPGVFDCLVCGETIMSDADIVHLGVGQFAHDQCLNYCRCCGLAGTKEIVDEWAWPVSGIVYQTCQRCKSTLEKSACATCLRCRELVYIHSQQDRLKDCCRVVSRAIYYEANGVDLETRQRRVYSR